MKQLTPSSLALTAVFLAPPFAFSQPGKTEMKTYTYKTVGACAAQE
jgi:hypothetical protein